MSKIAIVIPDLRGGGAERVMVDLANDWVARGHEVVFILLKYEGDFLGSISAKVRFFVLDTARIRLSLWPLVRCFRYLRPNIILANMWPLTSVATASWIFAGRPGKLFLLDHVQLSISCVRELALPIRLMSSVMHLTYRLASGILAVSSGVAYDIAKLSGLPRSSIKVIHNPVRPRVITKNSAAKNLRFALWGGGSESHILSVGSFKYQKNHRLLIQAFSKVCAVKDAKLVILGEGALRAEIESLICELGLSTRILLPGFFPDPSPWFLSADLFVLSSDWEGFGNVIVESLDFGLPVVSTDCQSGPAEILDYGRYGRLVPVGDETALVEAVLHGLSSKRDSRRLRRRAQDFSLGCISRQYLRHFGIPENV